MRNWFGESDDSDGTDESDPEDGEEWYKVERKEKNMKKKKKAEEKKKLKRRKVTEKAKMIVGIGPIKKSTIEHFTGHGRNLEDAKIEALKEYLDFYLHYSKKDIEELEIGATQICQKDDFLYVAFTDFDDIRELHSRIAECKDDRIQVRNFVPPQYFHRYMFLSKRCSEVRAQNKATKTQLRFNGDDVEILLKDKGSSEPYRVIGHEEICNVEDIPDYDDKLVWKTKKDRITRTNRQQSPNRGEPPSQKEQSSKNSNVHSLSRASSMGDAPRKKPRKDTEIMNSNVDTVSMNEIEEQI